MSVIIDGKDFTKYIEIGLSFADGGLRYEGLGIEDEGKKLEMLLKQLPAGMPVRVEDTKFCPHRLTSGVYQIISIQLHWEKNIFKFEINLMKV